MSLINVANIYRSISPFIIVFFGLLLMNCNKQTSEDIAAIDIESDILQRGSVYLENGNYEQAEKIYTRFVNEFSEHPYVDDAAYRLAYISVIADETNPYFSYENGLILFQNFIENYPNSRYIIACQNWINLLQTVEQIKSEQKTADRGEGTNSVEINRLKNELKRVQAENTRLKNTLDELQKAIER